MKFRHEYKHIINMSDMIQLRCRLSPIFGHDTNAGEDGTYYVKSLYFDNHYDKALREKIDGVNYREKFRIRFYNNNTDFIRLEKKSKINGLCNKVSCEITKDECVSIINGNIEFLNNSDCMLKKELFTKMKSQLLRPKSIVGYRRESFVFAPGNVRITIDYNISGNNDINNFFNPDISFPCSYSKAVLEVKWDEFLPQIVKDAVHSHCRQSGAFSKYAVTRI